MNITLRRKAVNSSLTIASPYVDWNLNTLFQLTISADTVFTFGNAVDGQTIIIKIINSSASARTLTWPAESTGASTTISASKTKLFTFIKMGSTIYASSMEY